MILAPYHVPWTLSASAFALLGIGLCWMVFHDTTLRVMAQLKLSDGIAIWLIIAAAYHTTARLNAPPFADMGDVQALWILWAWAALYAGMRLVPSPLRREVALLALALAGWAGCIGAGFPYLGGMEARAELLRERPNSVLTVDAPDLSPLTGALALGSLGDETKLRVGELVRDLKTNLGITAARKSAVRQVLFPELLEHYRRETSRLYTYQVLQIVLISAVLLAWGFGRKHSD